MIKKLSRYFDKLEDKLRAKLSKFPVLYAFIGGLGIVLFWHSVTELALAIPLMNNWHALPWFIVSMLLLLTSGIFVSYFVGDQLIISGIRGEKKLIEKSCGEIANEEKDLAQVLDKLENLEQKIDTLVPPEKE